MSHFVAWFFATRPPQTSLWRVVLWWEVRRLPFNLIVGLYGLVCLVAFFWAITTSGHLQAGEDVLEPLALLAAPIAVNLFYTLGWLVEVPSRLVVSDLAPRFGPLLLKLGLGLGVFLITLPAAVWVGYRLLQVVGLVS
jgi:hypothetical protein